MTSILDMPPKRPAEKPERTELICANYPWEKHDKRMAKIRSRNRRTVATVSMVANDKLNGFRGTLALITAAPELYNALADTVDACWDRMPEDLRKQAVSALAKATDTDLAGPDCR